MRRRLLNIGRERSDIIPSVAQSLNLSRVCQTVLLKWQTRVIYDTASSVTFTMIINISDLWRNKQCR